MRHDKHQRLIDDIAIFSHILISGGALDADNMARVVEFVHISPREVVEHTSIIEQHIILA